MGSWYDNLKKLPKPNSITIKRQGSNLKIILHYHGKKGSRLQDKEILIDEEVHIDLERVGVEVEKGELWGDWGGPIKCGDVLYIHKSKHKFESGPEKVTFT